MENDKCVDESWSAVLYRYMFARGALNQESPKYDSRSAGLL